MLWLSMSWSVSGGGIRKVWGGVGAVGSGALSFGDGEWVGGGGLVQKPIPPTPRHPTLPPAGSSPDGRFRRGDDERLMGSQGGCVGRLFFCFRRARQDVPCVPANFSLMLRFSFQSAPSHTFSHRVRVRPFPTRTAGRGCGSRRSTTRRRSATGPSWSEILALPNTITV